MKKIFTLILALVTVLAVNAEKFTYRFNSTPLSEAIKEIAEDHSDLDINFIYNELENYKTSSIINTKNPYEALRQTIGLNPVTVVKSKNTYYVEALQHGKYNYIGRIIGKDKEPIEAATVLIMEPKDSVVLTYGITNEKGYFSIPCDKSGVIVKVSSLGYKSFYRKCEQFSLGTIILYELPIELKTVNVVGERRIQKNGYELLLLSNKNRDYGTNALDAVSSLSYFVTSLNEDKLLAWDRSEVYILINGVPSTATDLRSFKAADIKNVEYYTVAPPQYMSLTNGPLINVILKKKHDRLFSGYFNTSNAITTGFGTNQIDLSYRDSLNQIKIGYFVDYRDINNINSVSEYNYPNSESTTYRDKEKYKGQYHNIFGSFQHYRTNQLFNAKISLLYQPTKETSNGNVTFTENTGSSEAYENSFLKSGYKAASVDLYYNFMFHNGSIFALNVVNTIGKSHSESEIDSHMFGAVNSLTNNNSYSLVANAFYASRALGGNYTVGSRYEYKQLEQTFNDNKVKPYSHNEFLNFGMSWMKNGMTFTPALGLNIIAQSDGYVTRTKGLPYLRLYADWWGKDKLKGFTTQLTLLSRSQAPALSLTTAAYNYMDYRYIAIGNPQLKNYWENSAKLTLAYFFPNRNDQIVFVAQTNYTHNSIASILSYNNNKAVIQPENLNHTLNSRLDLYGSWYPFSWLEISPYLEYYNFHYKTSYPVNSSYFRYGGNISATWKHFAIVLNANSRTKEFDGDIISKGSMQFAATVQYKYNNWSFGAKYNFSGHNDITYGGIENFKLSELKDWKPLHYMVRLTATYSFSVGKSRNHSQKYINDSSEDNGLNQYNTPKNPK